MGWAYSEWVALPKVEKARWIAHTRLEAAAKQYSANKEKLEKGGVTLEEFMKMTSDERDSKLFTTRILT